jgi:hypothetical protein
MPPELPAARRWRAQECVRQPRRDVLAFPRFLTHPVTRPKQGDKERASAPAVSGSPRGGAGSGTANAFVASAPTIAGSRLNGRRAIFGGNAVRDSLDLPPVADMVAMSHEELLALLARLDALADVVAEARGALRALLHETPVPAPLLDAKEAARRLGVSVDTVRAKGPEWDIEVYLGEGLYRYDPAKVEALRQRRRLQPNDPVAARLSKIG